MPAGGEAKLGERCGARTVRRACVAAARAAEAGVRVRASPQGCALRWRGSACGQGQVTVQARCAHRKTLRLLGFWTASTTCSPVATHRLS